MKTYLDCVPCFVRQALDAARMAGGGPAVEEQLLREVLRRAAELDMAECPPRFAQHIHRTLRRLSNNPDPYAAVKKQFNGMILGMLPELRARVRGAADPFDAAVRLAVAGNIIDFGPNGSLVEKNVLEAVARALTEPLHGDMRAFRRAVEDAGNILYLGDNTGEIVFDRLLVEELLPKPVTFAVRGAPILNDATLEDAAEVGLAGLVRVIGNGSDAPGTLLDECSPEFCEAFRAADLVIAKGQGNFETLCDEPVPVWFLFKAKCPVVAEHAGVPLGTHILARTPAG